MKTQNLSFIPHQKIDELLESSFINKDNLHLDAILTKARELKGLSVKECAYLLNIEDAGSLEALFETARYIKDTIYGKRIVFFAPLYLSNYCTNNCEYCGFRSLNKDMHRHASTKEEIEEEVRVLLKQGHKRLMVLTGEHPSMSPLDYLIDSLETIYSVKEGKGDIRRINVEIAPLDKDGFKRLKEANIGTYVCFQETYHPETYERMHPAGKKRDYNWRVEVMDRAIEGGIDDFGIGALYGLYNYKYEVLSLLFHAEHLDTTYGVGPHTISVPRIEPAYNAPVANNIPHPVDDISFKKIVAILRCAVPYTGIILTTREKAKLRGELLDLGISQMSAGSKTAPGGYLNSDEKAQFSLGDERSLDEVIYDVLEHGYVPSFCTGCYRKGRVGKDFMDLAKPGLINAHCLPNALFTFMEYLEDYAGDATYKRGKDVIDKMLSDIKNSKVLDSTKKTLKEIAGGKRDLYF
jgi:2-iminoacetate synthase